MTNIRQKIYSLLRWSERYTKTDNVYLAKGGGWLTAGQTISSALALILTIGFANLIPPHDYGIYRYVVSWINLLTAGTIIGLNTSLIQSVARGLEGSFGEIFFTKLKWSALASLGSLILAVYYFINNDRLLGWSFVITATCLPLLKTSGLYAAILYGRKDFSLSTKINSFTRAVSVLAMLGTLLLTDNLILILFAFFLPETLLQLYFTLYILRKTPPNNLSDPNTRKYGLHLSLMEVLKVIASQIDKLLVFHYLGAAELAIYYFALAVPGQVKSVLQNTTSLALPKMSGANSVDLKNSLPQKIWRLELIMIVVVLLYIIIAPTAYQFVFPQYLESVLFSQVLAVSLLFLPRTFLSTAMVAKGKHRELYGLRITSPIARIFIIFISLRWFGLWGLITGRLVADFFQLMIYQFYFKRAFRETTPLD
ncbi:MAG: oligosaccharide flippase family protein [Patescibacteria group bacterium]